MKVYGTKSLLKTIRLLLSLHLKQLFRWLKLLGWARLVILLVCVLAVFFLPVLPLITTFFIILLVVHTTRKDHSFLAFLQIPVYPVFFLEYLLICLPAFILSLFARQWWGFSLLFAAALLPALPSNIRSTIRHAKHPIPFVNKIPIELYEWRSSLRKMSYFYLVLYLLLLVTGFLIRFVHMLSLPILTFVSIPALYNICEPFQLLEVYGKSTHSFLGLKFLYTGTVYSVLAGPFFLLSLIEHTVSWYVIPILFLMCLLMIANIVWAKYAFYEPGKNLGKSISAYTLGYIILPIGFMIPPVLILTAAWYYWRSQKKLKDYLYAYH